MPRDVRLGEALEAKEKADEEFAQSKEDGLNYLLGVIHEAEEEEKSNASALTNISVNSYKPNFNSRKPFAATLRLLRRR